jgi:hypothetical protein
MALINCRKCGRKISDKSSKCIGCGTQLDLVSNVELIDKEMGIVDIEKDENESIEFKNQVINQSHLINFDKNSDEIITNKASNYKFDSQDPDYKVFKITNVVLLIVLIILEIGFAAGEGKRANFLAVYISFLISRSVIRFFYIRKIELRKDNIIYKISFTIIVWIIAFLLKFMLVITILNFAF